MQNREEVSRSCSLIPMSGLDSAGKNSVRQNVFLTRVFLESSVAVGYATLTFAARPSGSSTVRIFDRFELSAIDDFRRNASCDISGLVS